MIDVAVTWPKTRPLGSYYAELKCAMAEGKLINFRLPARPRTQPQRCYMVYDGAVRCWSPVVGVEHKRRGDVIDPVTGRAWPEGWYLVRRPLYVELATPVPMRGFQGFRYVDREELS